MIKKIVTSTLIAVMLSSSGAMVYANTVDKVDIEGAQEAEAQVENKEIEIISPKINSSGEVLQNKDLLISVKILTEAPVFLSVYEELEEKDELIFGPKAVKPGENFKTYNDYIKNIKLGKYKMEFTKENEENPFIVKSFTVIEGKKGAEKAIENHNLKDKKITDFMLGQ